ncbi:ATP-binding protein [Chitinibacter fontanus]|uniref:ATP-binding protein n=1 Tax=Chitinibacter fontanus TaxID=1737446 RepID=A0A7D5ZB42_9NEIS|nr:ATP-binding protein [Chitinibacter fontanus]QLI80244.1 ATP-binding protein [Chitinibacter fontanus]
MTIVVKIPPRMNVLTIDTLLKQTVNEALVPISKEITYDLTGLEKIEPVGVTVFSNLLEWLLACGVSQKFNIPNRNSGAIKYLDDSLFFERYTGAKIFNNASVRDTTLPLKWINHPQSHLWLENHLITWLAKVLATSKKSLIELRICLLELFNNIRDHSGENAGCIFVQFFPKRKKVVISLSDFGVGIPANVKKIHQGLSDGEAVKLAMQEGFTTNTTVRNRGVGLFLLAQTVVDNNGGELTIRSGDAHVCCNKDGVTDLSDYSGFYKGTLFDITLHTDKFDKTLADDEEFLW